MANNVWKAVSLTSFLVLSSFLYVTKLPNATAYGNETIQVDIDGASTYIEYLEGVTFTITLSDLDTNVNYDLEWRICDERYSSDGDWVDGNCNDIETYTEYTDSLGEIHYAEAKVGESITIPTGVETYTWQTNIPTMWNHGITDGQGNNVESYTLHNGDTYHVGVMLTISGVTIQTGESTPFAYGHSGYTSLYPQTSGNILENMDYSFSITNENIFSSNYVQSMINWEITDDSTTQVVAQTVMTQPLDHPNQIGIIMQ